MTKFTEEKLEQAFIELLENEGYPHHLGNTIIREDDEVLIEEDLKTFLLTRYKKQHLTANVIDKAKQACKNSGQELKDHFPRVEKLVKIGSGANRDVGDIQLSCSLKEKCSKIAYFSHTER